MFPFIFLPSLSDYSCGWVSNFSLPHFFFLIDFQSFKQVVKHFLEWSTHTTLVGLVCLS